MSIQKQLAKNIIAARKEKKLSQEELAHLADIDRSNYGKIEQGIQDCRINTLLKIANALDVDIKSFFYW